MSGPELISTLRSTDHGIIVGLRFLNEYAKHLLHPRNSHASEDTGRQFVPRFDVEEHEQSYEIYGELPGADKDHITVEANDDRNIQISGWIPRINHDAAAPYKIVEPGTDDPDPVVTAQHHGIHEEEHRPSMERFGEALNPHHEPFPAASSSSGPVTSHSPATPQGAPAVTSQEKPA
jgi:hypothetical protein